VEVDVSIVPPDDTRRDPADLELYSAVREMLSNVVKHSAAQRVSIELRRERHGTAVTVTDDGVGIRPGRLEQRLTAGHIGVASHRLRIEAAGGTLTLTPNTPHGTIASVTIPLAP
jgi:two-component system, NarL family, sensor kinase